MSPKIASLTSLFLVCSLSGLTIGLVTALTLLIGLDAADIGAAK